MTKKVKVGLVLSSGGYRGLAHIGVIKVLMENKIPIDFVSGASAGSLVGAYFALYGEVNSLEKLILSNSKDFTPAFFDFSLTGGFIKGDKLKVYFNKVFRNAQFSQTKIPLYIIATDLVSGQPVTISSGKIVPAVLGSISVPLVFRPLGYKEKLLVDGGLSDPVPVKILKEEGAEKIIAVNLYHKNEFVNKKFTISKIALRSTRIALHNLSKISVHDADVVINPDTSTYIDSIKVSKYFIPENVKEIISIGEKEARLALPLIKNKLGIE